MSWLVGLQGCRAISGRRGQSPGARWCLGGLASRATPEPVSEDGALGIGRLNGTLTCEADPWNNRRGLLTQCWRLTSVDTVKTREPPDRYWNRSHGRGMALHDTPLPHITNFLPGRRADADATLHHPYAWLRICMLDCCAVTVATTPPCSLNTQRVHPS